MAGAWVLEGAVLAPWEQGQKPRVRGKLLYSETSAAPCQVSGPALVPSLPSASLLQKESSTDGGVLGPGGGVSWGKFSVIESSGQALEGAGGPGSMPCCSCLSQLGAQGGSQRKDSLLAYSSSFSRG